MGEKELILDRRYSWEDLNDVSRDVEGAIEEALLPGTFKGHVRITIIYEEAE